MTATCECNPSFNCESKNEQILKSFCQNYIDQGKNLHMGCSESYKNIFFFGISTITPTRNRSLGWFYLNKIHIFESSKHKSCWMRCNKL